MYNVNCFAKQSLEPPWGFEPQTSSLPWMRSTPELRWHAVAFQKKASFANSHLPVMISFAEFYQLKAVGSCL